VIVRNLTFQVFIAALIGIAGAAIFADASWQQMVNPPYAYELILLVKQVFLAALRMLIAPMIFFSLIGGIIGIGNIIRYGKLLPADHLYRRQPGAAGGILHTPLDQLSARGGNERHRQRHQDH